MVIGDLNLCPLIVNDKDSAWGAYKEQVLPLLSKNKAALMWCWKHWRENAFMIMINIFYTRCYICNARSNKAKHNIHTYNALPDTGLLYGLREAEVE